MGSLLRESSFGLKLERRLGNTLIGHILSFDQVFGRALLKQASGFEAHGSCIGMTSKVLDHDMTTAAHGANLILYFRSCAEFR
jgi:hypothetical protein